MARVAEWIPRDVSSSDIRSMFLAANPFGGISVARRSIIEPAVVSNCYMKARVF